MKRLTEQQKLDIIKLYKAGVPPLQIGKQFEIWNNSVTRILRKAGVLRTQLIRISEDTEKFIIDQYVVKEISSEIIAQNLGIDGTTVCRVLKRNGIKLRPPTQNKRQYKIPEDYFETIDTEEKAYFLGMLLADGNLAKKGHGIKLLLHIKDNDVLEKFSMVMYGFLKIKNDEVVVDILDDDGNVVGHEIRVYGKVNVYCEKMHSDLIKLGCAPNKSHTITFPSQFNSDIPEHLMRHFIRGHFDGDGCISLGKPVVDVTSTKDYVEGLSKYLKDKLNIDEPTVCRRHLNRDTPTQNIQYTSRANIKAFLDFMYDGAKVYMERKYQSYLAFLEMLKNKQTSIEIRTSDISRYGTSLVPSWNGIQLVRRNVEKLSKDDKEAAAKFVFDFYRNGGFPFVNLSNDEIVKDFTRLKNYGAKEIECMVDGIKILRTTPPAGIATMKHFSPHFFDVKSGRDTNKPSMLETYKNDELFMKVVKNRIDRHHTISGNGIKQGLPNSKKAFKASIFCPAVAKFIYSTFCKEGDVIYDYSMGFGQRLMGALSLPFSVKYVGVDPLSKSVESNKAIFEFLHSGAMCNGKEAEFFQTGSEIFCDERYHGKINVAFSSPPYFDVEVYEHDKSQAYHNGSYYDFINAWWKTTISNISKLLEDDGVFILNMENEAKGFNILDDMIAIVENAGFVKSDEYRMQVSRNDKFNNANGEMKYEPIICFRRAQINANN